MFRDRIAGAIIGALIGDALGLGPHWYYDLDEQHRDYGEWISDYTTPKPNRYHAGMKAGQLSQTGIITVMLLRSVVECKGYRESDFTRRMDQELFPLLDGSARKGPGGYTNQSIRETYENRVKHGKSWKESGGYADTTEAAERAVVLTARYAKKLPKVVELMASNCVLTQRDEAIVTLSAAFNCILAQLINGDKITPKIIETMSKLVNSGALPFHKTVSANKGPESGFARFSSPDALFTPGYIAMAVQDPGIKIEPAWKVSFVYGLSCAIYQQLPAAYYLATRFSDDFESAVLHAVNGGGNNMSRAMLTGALVGAQVGLSNIPQRFIDGLENSKELIKLANELAVMADKE